MPRSVSPRAPRPRSSTCIPPSLGSSRRAGAPPRPSCAHVCSSMSAPRPRRPEEQSSIMRRGTHFPRSVRLGLGYRRAKAILERHRGVAQLGSALRSGRRGRGFKSRHPDRSAAGTLVSRRFSSTPRPSASPRARDRPRAIGVTCCLAGAGAHGRRHGLWDSACCWKGGLFGFVARESYCFSWSCLPRSCEYCVVPCVWLSHDPSR